MTQRNFTDEQLSRYARHIVLPELGGVGQAKLMDASVLVIGAGGLGSPLLLYLAAAGVGRIGVVDDDVVDLSNLQRQVMHDTARVGDPKVESARDAIARVNPEVRLEPHRMRFTAANALALIAQYDLVADGSDNFATRFLVNDACHLAKKPLVSGAILRFEGQLSTFKSGVRGKSGVPGTQAAPCYRCIFPEAPPAGLIPTCAEGGVLGAVAGAIGSLQATEVIKELAQIGDSLSGWLLIYDALSTTFRKVRVKRDPACALCGDAPTIRDLSAHANSQGPICVG
jgi:molybdopterin/thiamine biosynthesis adenylyltransferase